MSTVTHSVFHLSGRPIYPPDPPSSGRCTLIEDKKIESLLKPVHYEKLLTLAARNRCSLLEALTGYWTLFIQQIDPTPEDIAGFVLPPPPKAFYEAERAAFPTYKLPGPPGLRAFPRSKVSTVAVRAGPSFDALFCVHQKRAHVLIAWGQIAFALKNRLGSHIPRPLSVADVQRHFPYVWLQRTTRGRDAVAIWANELQRILDHMGLYARDRPWVGHWLESIDALPRYIETTPGFAEIAEDDACLVLPWHYSRFVVENDPMNVKALVVTRVHEGSGEVQTTYVPRLRREA